MSCEVVVDLVISGMEKEAIHDGRGRTWCVNELKGEEARSMRACCVLGLTRYLQQRVGYRCISELYEIHISCLLSRVHYTFHTYNYLYVF